MCASFDISVAEELENQDFAKFAFQEKSTPTSSKAPPTQAEVSHLHQAYESIQRTIGNVRKLGMNINKHGKALRLSTNLQPSNKTNKENMGIQFSSPAT